MVKRCEVWWANLANPKGSEPGFRRPVLVVQSDAFNRSAIRTVVVVAITSNLALAAAPGNVRLRKGSGGLSKPSVVNVSQLHTVNRAILVQRIGALPDTAMREVDGGLKLVLGV